MKKILKLSLLFVIMGLIFTISGCKKKKPVESSFPEIVNKLTTYKLVGRLESTFPSGTKECQITTYYRSPGEYRVEIQNPNVNETQIMVKNTTGVFVIIPSINKTFKVNSNWPSNMSYPYLLQSLSNDIVGDTNLTTTKEGNNTIVELKAKLFNEDESTTQKIIFDENNLPKEVLTYDKNKNLLTRFVVQTIDQNPSLNDELFSATETLETLNVVYQENPLTFERMISYPTYYSEGTSLKEENITGDANNKLAVMTFSGTTHFTIVQKFVNYSKEAKYEYVNGDIYIMGGVFTFVNGNNIQFYENGVEYTIASNTIECMEMIKMAESLRTTDGK
jgi:sporulation protein ydcC